MPSFPHLHVLLNHLPLMGTAAGAAALLIALLMKSRAAAVPPLVVIAVCAASAWVVNVTGQRAYKEIRGLADDEGVEWLDTHMERAERFAFAFYGVAALATVGLLLPKRWPKAHVPLAVVVLVAAGATAALAGWIAQAGGQVRHPEFRNAEHTASPQPSAGQAPPHHHD